MWGSLSDGALRTSVVRGVRMCAAIGLGAGLACSIAPQANAQVAPEYLYLPNIFQDEVPRGETVRTRPRPELDALGLHLGPFFVFPSLTNGLSYNDNIFATHSNAKSDFIDVVEPKVAARSDWNRHEVAMQAGGRLGFYFDHTDENFRDAYANASGRLDVSSNTILRGRASINRDHEERGDPDDAGGSEPSVFYTFAGALEGSHRFNRLTVSVGGEVRRYDFQSVDATGGGTINQDDRDRMVYRPAVKAAYEVHPGYSAFVRAEGEFQRYDKHTDSAGFIRDSQGYDIVGGAALDLTGLLFGDAYAGIRQRYFEDSRFDTVTGPVVGATLTWVPTGLTTVKLQADSQIIESTSANTSSYTSTGAGVTVDHELLRNLILTAGAGIRYDDYDGVSRTDVFYTGTVGADYLMNRYLNLGARYSYSLRDSDAPGADYSRNLITLLLTAKL